MRSKHGAHSGSSDEEHHGCRTTGINGQLRDGQRDRIYAYALKIQEDCQHKLIHFKIHIAQYRSTLSPGTVGCEAPQERPLELWPNPVHSTEELSPRYHRRQTAAEENGETDVVISTHCKDCNSAKKSEPGFEKEGQAVPPDVVYCSREVTRVEAGKGGWNTDNQKPRVAQGDDVFEPRVRRGYSQQR